MLRVVWVLNLGVRVCFVPTVRAGLVKPGLLEAVFAAVVPSPECELEAVSLSFFAFTPARCSFHCCRFLPLLRAASSEEYEAAVAARCLYFCSIFFALFRSETGLSSMHKHTYVCVAVRFGGKKTFRTRNANDCSIQCLIATSNVRNGCNIECLQHWTSATCWPSEVLYKMNFIMRFSLT